MKKAWIVATWTLFIIPVAPSDLSIISAAAFVFAAVAQDAHAAESKKKALCFFWFAMRLHERPHCYIIHYVHPLECPRNFSEKHSPTEKSNLVLHQRTRDIVSICWLMAIYFK